MREGPTNYAINRGFTHLAAIQLHADQQRVQVDPTITHLADVAVSESVIHSFNRSSDHRHIMVHRLLT